MRMDRLTSKFQTAISDAQSLAIGRDHQFIEPSHLMLALLDQTGGTVRHLLTLANINTSAVRSRLDEELDRLPKVEGSDGDVHLSNDLAKLGKRVKKPGAKDTKLPCNSASIPQLKAAGKELQEHGDDIPD